MRKWAQEESVFFPRVVGNINYGPTARKGTLHALSKHVSTLDSLSVTGLKTISSGFDATATALFQY